MGNAAQQGPATLVEGLATSTVVILYSRLAVTEFRSSGQGFVSVNAQSSRYARGCSRLLEIRNTSGENPPPSEGASLHVGSYDDVMEAENEKNPSDRWTAAEREDALTRQNKHSNHVM